jgi:hypothetical protein
MVRQRLSLRERRWSFSALLQKYTLLRPITQARTLAPTIRQHYENDLTHSNAAIAAGSRSLQAHCDRTVDFTQTS